MKKHFLITTALACLTISFFSIYSAAFSNTPSEKRHIPSDMLPETARAHYLSAKGDWGKIPKWLAEHFQGISVQDLIDYKMVPAFETTGAGDIILSLSHKNINDLSGIQNIPNADAITDLDLKNNLITAINPNTFVTFKNLGFIELQNNRIKDIAPKALATPKKIQFISLRGNNIPESERARIQEEIGASTTIFW